MFVMKRAAVPVSVAMFAILFLAGSIAARGEPRPAHRFANPLLDDVVAMTQAQVPDATILAFLRVRRARLESDITAEDLVALRDAGVHDEILRYIASQSGVEAPPPLPPLPRREAARPPEADDPDRPAPTGASGPVDPPSESRPVEPDESPDVPLIMGVYDTIPEGGYPCWPPNLAPYECGGGPIFVDGIPVSRRGESPSRRRPVQDRTGQIGRSAASAAPGARPPVRSAAEAPAEKPSGNGASRSGESGHSGGRSSGGGRGRH